ncbi:hypothetical protein [Dyadobacter sp. Leaf189]|uniref:hypothetical protein n=1 Tax=Dyadobacter sp. Leaf189 TaxID=1736295 RepID=UPI0006FB6103|nr:hypothetical protein [Dyadobacter sp. Leaf189]KQS23935.1 hypothetical protein ASG33_24730 [Dyadobacter sp. Leaf189]
MTKTGEEQDLKKCLMLIESQLSWGDSGHWSNYDFEKLSDILHEKTGVRLSITTLKRIWGKLKYDSAPTLTTLNALAKFAGFSDWRHFSQQERMVANSYVHTAPLPVSTEPATKKGKLRYLWLLSLVPLLLAGYVLLSNKASDSTLDPKLFSFRPDKIVTEGVPNSVVFHYDAKAAKTNSVFIAQTWDVSRKKLISKDKHEHSSIYYHPGYFNTKLIADNQIVKTQDLWITSGGWLCLAEEEPVPVYFKKEECVSNGIVEVNERVLNKYNLSLHPKAPRVRIFNQRDMGDLMSDNFVFETSVRSNFNQGTNACQPMQVLIQCKNDIIIIPLAAKPCIGDLSLAFCGTYVTSKEADLSNFGANLTEWTKLRVETISKRADIYVNDKKAYTLHFPNEATGIVGVQYRFNGTGAVKDTWFGNKRNVIRMNE